MKDKIIIDGVDVKECKYKNILSTSVECECEYETCYGYEITIFDYCNEHSNCYYKQLKRVEQKLRETEHELIMTKADLCNKVCQYKNDYKIKEQECLTLTNKINRLKEENDMLALLLEGKNNQYNWAMQKYEKLKNEKAEIKKYLGISSKTIMQRLEELQERKEEASVREDRYKQALDKIEYQAKELFLGVEDKDRPYCENILKIINKAKDGTEC